MNDRDRLIELIVNADTHDSYECRLCTKKDVSCIRCDAEKFADHLLANGVIVPPCKVGDWVWYVRDGKINKAKIEESIYSASKHGYFSEDWRFHAYNFSKKEEITFWLDDIGKTVFLTKEEAEAELKKER